MKKEDQERLDIQDTIDESGCQVIQIMGDDYIPSFAYTIGLYQQFNHPEIICFGLDPEVMQTLLNNVKDRVEDEQEMEVGEKYKGFLNGNAEVTFLEVNQVFYDEYLGYAKWFYGNNEFPVLQMVWPDKKLNFPWDKKFDRQLEFVQPLLDRNLDFWFYESKNLGVFATQQVLEGATIRYVVHDEEGDWFFMEDEDADSEDLQIVGLGEIVKRDPSLNSIYSLQYGWEATRADKDEEWKEQESSEYD